MLSLNRGLKILCSKDLYSVTSWFMFWESVSSSEFTSTDDISAGQNCLLYCFSDTRVTTTTNTPCYHIRPPYHHRNPYHVYIIFHNTYITACYTASLIPLSPRPLTHHATIKDHHNTILHYLRPTCVPNQTRHTKSYFIVITNTKHIIQTIQWDC